MFIGNLFNGETGFKKVMFDQKDRIVQGYITILVDQRRKVNVLIKSIADGLTNMAANKPFAQYLYSNTQLVNTLIWRISTFPRSSNLYFNTIQALLSVLINLCFHFAQWANQTSLFDILLVRFIDTLDQKDKKNQAVLKRAIQLMSKLNVGDIKGLRNTQKFIDKQKESFCSHAIRLHASNFDLLEYFQQKNPPECNIKIYLPFLQQKKQDLFCNVCVLLGYVADSSQAAAMKMGHLIPSLIQIVRNEVGNRRKNSTILVSKLSKYQCNKGIFREYHGMQVLKSVAQFIKKQ